MSAQPEYDDRVGKRMRAVLNQIQDIPDSGAREAKLRTLFRQPSYRPLVIDLAVEYCLGLAIRDERRQLSEDSAGPGRLATTSINPADAIEALAETRLMRWRVTSELLLGDATKGALMWKYRSLYNHAKGTLAHAWWLKAVAQALPDDTTKVKDVLTEADLRRLRRQALKDVEEI